MSRHDPRHRVLLEAIVSGEGDRATAIAQLRGCQDCERELIELEIVSEFVNIDSRGAQLSADALPPFEIGEAASRKRLLEHADRDFGGGRNRHRARPWLLLFASVLAAAVTALLVVRGQLEPASSPEPPPDVLIGGSFVELITPRGDTVSRGEFELTWTGELQEGDQFVIHMLNNQGAALPISPVRVSATRWAPSAEIMEDWPEVVRIQVALLDIFGDESMNSEWTVLRLEE